MIAFRRDEYDSLESVVELDFVDFGDFEEKKITEVFQIRQDFLRLKFQAIPCSLAHVKQVPFYLFSRNTGTGYLLFMSCIFLAFYFRKFPLVWELKLLNVFLTIP